MTYWKLGHLLVVGCAAAISLSGCSDDSESAPPAPAPVQAAPAITTQPSAVSIVAGASASFTVVATGTPTPTYQWQRDGTNISGATSATYPLPAVSEADSGSAFRVVITNTVGSVTSNAAGLTVAAVVVAPTITVAPQSANTLDGTSATLSVVATGTAPFTYVWQRNGTVIADASAATYTTPVLALADSGGQYSVIVTNASGSATSSAATITVNPVAPAIASAPASVSVTAGQTATFTATATGSAPLTYQWQRNGTAIAGATAASYTTPATAVADNGARLRVAVTNAAGTVTSAEATLGVSASVVAPTVATAPLSVTVQEGQTATFTATASGTAPLAYQWLRNSVAISGATFASYTTAATTAAADTGARFAVRVSNSGGSITSAEAVLTVQPARSPLIGRAWAPGQLTETDDRNVLFSTLGIDDAGRVTSVYVKNDGTRNVLYAVRGTAGAAGVAPVWSAPVVIDVQAGVPRSTNSYFWGGYGVQVVAAPGGNVAVIWPHTDPCTAADWRSTSTCVNQYVAFYNVASGSWSDPVLAGRTKSNSENSDHVSVGRLNDAGDFALLFNGWERSAAGVVTPRDAVAWRPAGQSTLQTKVFADAALETADLAMDAAGNMVLAAEATQNATRDMVVYRGSVSAGFGAQTVLDTRGSTASFGLLAVGTGGQQLLLWTQNNGTRDTVYAASAASAGAAFTVQDLGLTGLSSNAFLVVNDAGNAWLNDVGNRRRMGWQAGAWTAVQSLPASSELSSSDACAVTRRADMLCIGSSGVWATYNADTNLMVQARNTTSPGPGFVLGVSKSTPGRFDLSISGVGILMFNAQYDVLPTAAAPNGDGRNVTNLWSVFLK